MNISELRTPTLLVDINKVKRNAERMVSQAVRRNVSLRPHVKTHKTIEGARIQLGGKFKGITVSTMSEARFFMEAGFMDITYAFPITPDKLVEAAEISKKMVCFNLLIDHIDSFHAMERIAREKGIVFCAFIKIDPGYHRAGVNPKDDNSLDLARAVHESSNVELKGVLTHGGHSYDCQNPDEIRKVAKEEKEVLTSFAKKLENNGIPCPELSAGSTPTAVLGEDWAGITELRPGNYLFFDKFQADIGTCSIEDCAATVLTTVAGAYPSRNTLLVDAGALALSKDRGAAHLSNETLFGSVVGHQTLKIISLSQEHGLIKGEDPVSFSDFPIGARLQIIPNHSCLAAALFQKYYLVDGDEVVDEWRPVKGW